MSDTAILQQMKRAGSFGHCRIGACTNAADADAQSTDAEGQCQHRDVIFLTEGSRCLGDLAGGQQGKA